MDLIDSGTLSGTAMVGLTALQLGPVVSMGRKRRDDAGSWVKVWGDSCAVRKGSKSAHNLFTGSVQVYLTHGDHGTYLGYLWGQESML
jgi:hypothetical protein